MEGKSPASPGATAPSPRRRRRRRLPPTPGGCRRASRAGAGGAAAGVAAGGSPASRACPLSSGTRALGATAVPEHAVRRCGVAAGPMAPPARRARAEAAVASQVIQPVGRPGVPGVRGFGSGGRHGRRDARGPSRPRRRSGYDSRRATGSTALRKPVGGIGPKGNSGVPRSGLEFVVPGGRGGPESLPTASTRRPVDAPASEVP